MSGDSSSASSTILLEVLTKLALRHLSRLSTFQDGRPLDGIWSYTVRRSPMLFSFTMRGISRYRSLPAFVKGRRTPFLEATGGNDCVNSFLAAWNKSQSKLAGKTVHAAYLDLPTHNKLKVKARVHFFDKWEGRDAYCFVCCFHCSSQISRRKHLCEN